MPAHQKKTGPTNGAAGRHLSVVLAELINPQPNRVSIHRVVIFLGIKLFIHEFSCCCCSSSSGGMMLIRKRKMGLLAVNIERMGGEEVVKFKWKFKTSSLNWKRGGGE